MESFGDAMTRILNHSISHGSTIKHSALKGLKKDTTTPGKTGIYILMIRSMAFWHFFKRYDFHIFKDSEAILKTIKLVFQPPTLTW